MSWWFLYAILIYTFFLAPVSNTDSGAWFRFFYWLFAGTPALLFFYYCVLRGFMDIGVLS